MRMGHATLRGCCSAHHHRRIVTPAHACADLLPPTPATVPAAAQVAYEAGVPLGALRGSTSKKESITARLAAGEAPWDMLSLKAAIHSASPGACASLQESLRGMQAVLEARL